MEEGEFLQLPYFDARLVEEVFRRRVLQRLHRAERLSEEFLNSLLGWVHSGFSVHGEQTVPTEDVQGAERLARYLTRGPLPLDVVEKVEGGRLRVRTPLDPRTGLVEKILDPLDLIHALTTQIPDPGRPMVRYYGSCPRDYNSERCDGSVCLRDSSDGSSRSVSSSDPQGSWRPWTSVVHAAAGCCSRSTR